MDLSEKIRSLLAEKSPRTTSEIAELLESSWHSIHEKLLELQIIGEVCRIFIGNRHIWFLDGDNFSNMVKNGNGNGTNGNSTNENSTPDSHVTVVTAPEEVKTKEDTDDDVQ